MSSDLINLRTKINNLLTENADSPALNTLIASYLNSRIFDEDTHEQAIDGLQDGRFSDELFNDFIYRVTPWANLSVEELMPLFDEAVKKIPPKHREFLALGQKTKFEEPKTLEDWIKMLDQSRHPKKAQAGHAYRMLQMAQANMNAAAEEKYRTELRQLGAPV